MARKTTPRAAPDRSPGDRYLELIRRFPLRPIRSEAELDQAIDVIDSLVCHGRLTQDEDDYLDVLGDLVEKYETETDPLPPVSDSDMLRYLIEARETTQAKVSAGTGIAESTISEVLAGKRSLNRKNIEALARFFGVNPAVFLDT